MTYDEFRKLKVNDIIHRKIDANDNIYVFKITMIDDNGTKGQFYDPFYKDWVLVPPDYVGTRNYVSLIAGDAVEKLDIPETITDEYVEEKWKELQGLNIGDLNNKHTTLPVTWFLFPQGTILGDVTAWFDEQHSKGLSYLLNLDTSSEEDDTLEALVGDVEERSNTLAIDVEEEDGFDIDTGEDDEDDIEAESIISVFGAGNSMPLSKGNPSDNKEEPNPAMNEQSDPLWRDDISGFYPNHTLEDTVASESEGAEKVVSDSVWDKESDLGGSSDSLWKPNMSSSTDAAGQEEPESDSLEDTVMTSDVISDPETDTAAEVPDETLENMEPLEDTQIDPAVSVEEPVSATETIDELDEPEAFDTATVEEATPAAGSPEESNDTDQVNAEPEAFSFEESASDTTPDTAFAETVATDTVSAKTAVNTESDTISAATADDTQPDTVSVKKPDTDNTAFKEHNREDKIMSNHTVDSDVMKQAAASIRDEYLKLADQVASLSEEHFSAIQKYLTEQGVTDTNDGLIAFLKTHKNLLTSIYNTGIQVAADDGSPVAITPKMLTQIQKQLDIQAGKEIVLNSNPQELSDEDYLEIYHNFQNQ